MNKHKKFIKKAYNGELGLTMCSEWKEAIEKQYPEFKNQSKVGEWHKGIGKTLVCITNNDNGNIYGYGFDKDGKYWEDDSYDWLDVYNDLATKEEVEKALINEAKRRGYHKKHFICLNGNEEDKDYKSLQVEHDLWDEGSAIHVKNKWCFIGGKWAEIIETITKEEAEKQLGKKIV